MESMSKYPERAAKALVMDTSWSYCGACGQGAYPGQQAHIDVAGWRPKKGAGCGVRWEHITSSYCGERVKNACIASRPDLKWIDLYPGMAAEVKDEYGMELPSVATSSETPF